MKKPGPIGFSIWCAIFIGITMVAKTFILQAYPMPPLTDFEARIERGATLYGLATTLALVMSFLFLPVCWFRLRSLNIRIIFRFIALPFLFIFNWWGLTQLQGYSFNAPLTIYLYMGYAGLALMLALFWPRSRENSNENSPDTESHD